jgi:hypothetical protein
VSDRPQYNRRRGWLLVGLAIAVVVIAYLLFSGGDDNERGAEGPTIVTADQLRQIANDADEPIYWAGRRPGTRLEYERTSDGQVHVRYLTGSAQAGDTSQRFLAIGTYPVDNAYDVLQEQAKKQGNVRSDIPRGGIAVITPSRGTNVYLAYPDTDQQVEVFDPDPKAAIELATSGKVVPID